MNKQFCLNKRMKIKFKVKSLLHFIALKVNASDLYFQIKKDKKIYFLNFLQQ